MGNELLDILLPIYGCVGLGLVLCRMGFPWDARSISPLVLQVSLPLLIIHQFTRPDVTSGSVIQVIIAAAVVTGLFILVFGALIYVTKLPVRTYLAAACLPNMGIGLALGFLRFGDQGFAMCLAYASFILFAQFTLGRWVPSGRVDVKAIFRQSFLYALPVGMTLMFLNIHLPTYVERSLHLLGQMTIPLLLLALGFALGRVRFTGFGKGMLLATCHLAICVGIGVGVAWALSLQGEERTIVILMSILPSSTINILMAQNTDIEHEPLTIFVTCTNLWLLVSLPIALTVLF